MNETLFVTLCTSVGGAIGAIRRDYQSYRDAKKLDPTETWKWGLAVAAAAEGLLLGLSTGLAGSAIFGKL